VRRARIAGADGVAGGGMERRNGCADGACTAAGVARRLAQFCANRLVRRETGALPEIFFHVLELPPRRSRNVRVDGPATPPGIGALRCVCRKALVLRVGWKWVAAMRGRGGNAAGVRGRRVAGRRLERRRKKIAEGVDSEKNRD